MAVSSSGADNLLPSFDCCCAFCLNTCLPACSLPSCRDAEEELVTVADEKDRLAPQVEEARWRSRQLEKELSEVQVGGWVARVLD